MNIRPGSYIVFEGVDGAGKTTQIDLLVKRLRQQGFGVVQTREPGSQWIGLNVRQFVLSTEAVQPSALELLFQADRAEHTASVFEMCRKGFIVISDRSFVSGFAYALSHNHRIDHMIPILDFAIDVIPDFLFFLDCSAETSEARLQDRTGRTREEDHGLEFRNKVRKNFLEVIFGRIGRDHDLRLMDQFDEICSKYRFSTENKCPAETALAIANTLGL